MTRYDLSDPDAVSFCRSCGAGYRAGPVRCVDCDEPLVGRTAIESLSRPPSAGLEEPAGSWVFLGDVTSPFQADVLTSALEEAHIEFVARPSGYFETAGRGGLRFLVQPGDHDAASQILEELEQLEQAPLEDEAEGESVDPLEEVIRVPDRWTRATTFDLTDPDAVCFCPSCGMGYRAGFTRCADCEEILVSRNQVEDWLKDKSE